MGELDEPLTPTVPTSVTCPNCGVAVAVGYPRCPRCHAAVPQGGRATLQTFRGKGLAGGTSVAPHGGSVVRFAAIAAGAVIAIAVGLWLVTRDGDQPAATGPDDDTEAVEEEEGAGDDEVVADDEAPATVREGASEARRDAIRALEETLRGEQLWSKVRGDGDTVTIESSLCDDPAMSPAIGASVSELRAAGVAIVECIAPHGAVVFSRSL